MYTYQYPRPAVTADCVVFGRTPEGDYRLLLIERGNEPFKGLWALPGGFMEMDETLEECALRELEEETGIHVDKKDAQSIRLTEVGSYSKVDRDPRGRTITVAFLMVIPLTQAEGRDDAARARWFPLNELPPLAFDHKEIVSRALLLLRK